MDSYEKLFCRRCFIYDCREHDLDQPRPVHRRIPSHSFLTEHFFFSFVEHHPWASIEFLVKHKESAREVPEDLISLDPCHPKDCFISSSERDESSSDWTENDKALLYKLLIISDPINFCELSKILSKPCFEVWKYSTEQGIADHRCSSWVNKVSGPNPSLKSNKASKSSWMDPKYRRNSSGQVDIMNHIFFSPCDHPGPCGDPDNCVCARNGTFCEKFCACDSSCKQRFPGCKCTVCSNKSCPCFAAGRECDPDICSCDSMEHNSELRKCRNSGLFHQDRKHLSIAPSQVHGWGAFARTDIKKNELVTEYIGEIVSQAEADRRGRVYDKLNRSYLFNLNNEFVIDSARKGNKVKFANHSENPNCFSKIMRVNGDQRIGIYAKQAIRAGEELFFHYNHKAVSTVPEWFEGKRRKPIKKKS